MEALQGTTAADLVRAVDGLRIEEARRIVSATVRGYALLGPLDQVRRTMLELVRARFHVPTLDIESAELSPVDGFGKLALRTADRRIVEAVRIPLEDPSRASACVSSQVGCALACSFCATGRLGFSRNLETWEIVEQVRLLRGADGLGGPRRIHGVVFQGMGEPMLNLDRVVQAIRVLSEPSGLAIDMRAMTVCTSGIPDGIRRIGRELPKVRVGLSIGHARADKRRSLMPIEAVHSLESALEALAEHTRLTGLKPLVAYTPLAGVNDGEADADALAEALGRFAHLAGTSARLSVIPYNRQDSADPYSRQGAEQSVAFLSSLRARGLFPHVRYSGAGDIAAACGQLASSLDGGRRVSLRARPNPNSGASDDSKRPDAHAGVDA